MTTPAHSSTPPDGTPDERARALVERLEREIRPLTIASHRAEWQATTTGTREAQQRSAEAEGRLRRRLASSSEYAEIRETLAAGVIDPLLRRQLRLLELDYLPNQLPGAMIDDLVTRGKEIEAEFQTFRAELDGRSVTDNQIVHILRTERDTARRRAAWEASKQIGPRVAEPLLELVERRNRAARSLGFRDYYALRLHVQEIDEAELLGLFTELEELTSKAFTEVKSSIDRRLARRYSIATGELRPWHYEDPFFQEPPLSQELGLERCYRGRDLVALAARFFEGLGLPVDEVLERSDLEERAGKDQHAYCMDVDREGDIRILCNLKEDERWMSTLLHELGHAAYDRYIASDLPWLLRQPSHTATTEAIALFMGRFAYDVDWLEGMTGERLDDRDALGRRTREAARFELLLMARWVPVMTLFERELYADPDPERLPEVWWELVRRFQGLTPPEGRRAPDWAAKIHLTVAPVYYHNYLLGELIAEQLEAAIDREVLAGAPAAGYVGRSDMGGFLRDRVFAPGASLHWQEHLRVATGSELSPQAFVDRSTG